MAAQGIFVLFLLQGGLAEPPLTEHIDPERSSTSMATISLREAWPWTVRGVEPNASHFINQAGTLVVAVTVTSRRLALLGELTTVTVLVFITVPVVFQFPDGKLA